MLSRCTSEATYHHEQLIDVTWEQSLMDERKVFFQVSREIIIQQRKENYSWLRKAMIMGMVVMRLEVGIGLNGMKKS